MIISKVEATDLYRIITHDDEATLSYASIKAMAASGSIKFFHALREIQERWPEELI